eukprot:scaffold255283_cov67-Attheya_sp.AAC.1
MPSLVEVPSPPQREARPSVEEELRKTSSQQDRKLDGYLLLRKRTARLKDCYTEIQSTVDNEENLNDKEIRRELKVWKRAVLPMMKTALDDEIPQAINDLNTIPGASYVHRTNEAKENRDARDGKQNKRFKKSLPLCRIENTLHEQQHPNEPRKIRSLVPLNRRLPLNRPSIPREIKSPEPQERLPRMPPPANGRVYSADECVKHLVGLDSKTRSVLINKWTENKLVDVHRATIYRKIASALKTGNVSPFGRTGRPAYLDDTQMEKVANELQTKHGKSVGQKILREVVTREVEHKIRDQGHVPLQSCVPTNTTLVNIRAKLATHGSISISTGTIAKTVSRATAENSLISAMAFCVATAATHWYVSLESDPKLEDMINTRASEGARKLYSMLKAFHGQDVPLRSVKPYFILSTDDTVSYVFEGKGEEQDAFVLVGMHSNQDKHTRSQYHIDNSKKMSGLRVKLTYTFTATGLMAPVFVTVSGLTAAELPVETCPSGILALEIEGLMVAGGGVTIGAQGSGYLVFIRNDEDQDKDKKRVRFYRDKVLLPFINGLRRQFHGWCEGTPLTDEDATVSWCDGDNAQIQSIISEDAVTIYDMYRITGMKQNAARTGTEQAADLARVFPAMIRAHRILSLIDTPADLNPLKLAISRQFFSQLTRDKHLNLPSNKRNVLIDFVACVPQTMARACTTNGIVHGFKSNGMIDSGCKRYPDFYKMLATCRTNPTKEEVELCENSFPELLQEFLNQGHIPDATFERLGFRTDVTPDGETVRRDAGIECESRQRCKCLTHLSQVSLRRERLAVIEAEVNRKLADAQNKITKALESNRSCEEAIMKETQNCK